MQRFAAPSLSSSLKSRVGLMGGLALTVVAVAALATGCRGTRMQQPPIHWQWNMDFQQYYQMQEENPYFKDHRAMREPVAGTVARPVHLSDKAHHDDKFLQDDDAYYRGRDGQTQPGLPHGRYIKGLPPQVKLTQALLDRGHARFKIYCSACHGLAGDGKGVVPDRGVMQILPPNYHSARLRAMPLGYIYDVITNGFPQNAPVMEPYASQIPVPDRWAIAAWVRTLQVAEAARLADIPADVVKKNGWGNK